MASKQRTVNKRRRTTQRAYSKASKAQPDSSQPCETYWAAVRILKDNGTHYLIEWDGTNPGTGSAYKPTWEPHDFVTPALEAEWKEMLTVRDATVVHTRSRTQPYRRFNRQKRLNGPVDTDEDPRPAETALFAMRHNSPTLPLSSAMRTNFRQGESKESRTSGSPAHEELESSEQIEQKPLETGTCLAEKKRITLSPFFASKEPSEIGAQQKMQEDLEGRKSPPSVPVCETTLELSAEAKLVFPAEMWRKSDVEEAALVPAAATIEEQSQAPVGLERPLEVLSEECELHGEVVVQCASTSSDASEECEKFDESTSIPAPSEQRISPSPNRCESLRKNCQESQNRDPRLTEPVHSNITPILGAHTFIPGVSGNNSVERASKTERTPTGIQVKQTTRKGQFLERSKTGCGTCIMRKKECDEAKSECNNCIRSGLICEGYTNRVSCPQNGVAEHLPSLQAKEGTLTDSPQPNSRSQIYGLAHILNLDPGLKSNQSTHLDAHVPTRRDGGAAIAKKQERNQPTPSSWRTRRIEPPRGPYPSEHTLPPPSYPRLLPAPVQRYASHDLHHATHLVQIPPPSYHNPSVSHHIRHGMSQVVTNPPAAAVEARPQTTQQAQRHQHPPMALPTAASPGLPLLQKTEKQKMLDGEPFMPYNVQLVNERMQCTAAVSYFNSTANATDGITHVERERRFKQILTVTAEWIHRHHGERSDGGYVGDGVHVATPFYCDYGYNVSIGDNVIIGPDCHLLDSGRITIGTNTEIGARVTITTWKTPTDTKSLKGIKGTKVAKDVFIGENIYIGDGCTIEAGVRVGNGAIIRPGSVVVRDIARDCVVFGNPANVHKVNWAD